MLSKKVPKSVVDLNYCFYIANRLVIIHGK